MAKIADFGLIITLSRFNLSLNCYRANYPKAICHAGGKFASFRF
jgi:hypothetical protein